MTDNQDQVLHKSELFVRLLPPDATTEEVTDFFSQLAPVKHAVVVMHPGTQQSKGFGFVSFASADDAKIALDESKKVKFRGLTKLRVDYAKARTRGNDRDAPKEEKQAVEKRRPRLIIRNMPWSVRDKTELVKIFSKYGKVVDAFIPRTDNGRMTGFAFVTMNKKRHALKAIEESKELKIGGRQVAVDWAVEKSKWVNNEADDEEDESESESESEQEEDEEQEEEENESDGDEEDDEDEDEEDEEEEDDDEDKKPKVRGASNDVTIFVRNIPYDATAESLQDHFEQFGKVRYALPVMDKVANQPKGTAFVAFTSQETRDECVSNAPSSGASSLLIADDVDSRYVLDGRILSITKAVERETAGKLADLSAKKRDAMLGKEASVRDKRNTFLLNEGRITQDSKLASVLSKTELEIREQSFKERKQQISKNPSIHLSLTRLSIRNLPKQITDASLKQLARKAVVEFAKEVTDGKRQPLSKEEQQRSTKAATGENGAAKKSKHGVVRQAKIVREHKDSGGLGKSRGFGFVEFRDHRSALMGLRWLNAHLVTMDELKQGLTDEEAEQIEPEPKTRRLVVEFALENVSVLKKREAKQIKAKVTTKRKLDDAERQKNEKDQAERAEKRARLNDPKAQTQRIIAKKRRERKGKK